MALIAPDSRRGADEDVFRSMLPAQPAPAMDAQTSQRPIPGGLPQINTRSGGTAPPTSVGTGSWPFPTPPVGPNGMPWPNGGMPTPSPSGGMLGGSQGPSSIQEILKGIDPKNWWAALMPGSDIRKKLEAMGVEVQTASDGTPRGRLHGTGLDPDYGFKVLGWGKSPWDQGAPAGSPSAQGAQSGLSGSGQSANDPNNVFSDPATTQWEQLLRSVVTKLFQPQQTWSPSQLELQQTQVLDPLQRQVDAEKQQVIARFAAQGMGPSSGPVQQALLDVENKYRQLRTQAQGQFATQAIQREDQVFANNEARQQNAVGLMKQIPQMADDRLRLALSSLIPSNPANLLSLQQQYDQSALNQQNQQQQLNLQQQQQNAAFWANLAALIASAAT